MVQIAVTGQADARQGAELGSVTVRVEATGADRPGVLARAAEQHADLVAQARAHAESGAAQTWSTGDVTTGTFVEWIDGPTAQQQVRRYRAQAHVHVVFSDFEALGAWCLDVAARENVAVEHVAWDLTPRTRDSVLRELRGLAIRDAAERAATYAAATGLATPRLTAIYEEGLRPGAGTGPGEPSPLRSMRAAAFDGGGPTLELQPRDLELAVTVSADFEA